LKSKQIKSRMFLRIKLNQENGWNTFEISSVAKEWTRIKFNGSIWNPLIFWCPLDFLLINSLVFSSKTIQWDLKHDYFSFNVNLNFILVMQTKLNCCK
jgi:hypothetical protein